MKSNYKKIGNYIQQVNLRNKNLVITNLQGININKKFMPSVANTTGVDLSKYKIVSKKQFAFNPMHVGRDEMLPICMLEDNQPIIVSPAYTVFKVNNINELDPEYLMMWCRRAEFDRNAWFATDSSVRGGFSWEDFCNMELPVPSIEKQQEIVKEYNSIINRIKLNEEINQKLEDVAQSIFKHWFVDFEFPISKEYATKIGKPELEGKPYKSNGGKMIWNDELEKEIPEGWLVKRMENIIPVKDGTHDSPKPVNNGYPLITSTHLKNYELSLHQTYNISEDDFHQINKRSKVEKNDILFSMIGTVGIICYILYDKIDFAIKNVGLFKTSQNIEIAKYVLFYLKSKNAQRYINTCMLGSTQHYITLTDIRNIPIQIPPSIIINRFNIYIDKIINNLYFNIKENIINLEIHNLLLGKMTQAEIN